MTSAPFEVPKIATLSLGWLLHQNRFPPAIIAAVRAGTVRQLGFVTVWALRQRLWSQMIMGSPSVASRLGMSSFRIWHPLYSFSA